MEEKKIQLTEKGILLGLKLEIEIMKKLVSFLIITNITILIILIKMIVYTK